MPLEVIGRMVLNRNVDNFFAETEQAAFHPGNMVPGIDFTNDPLLQGRLFSYTDTQLLRLGGPNFHELEINRPRCPMRNFQRDGIKRQNVPTGRVAYEPNSLGVGSPRETPKRLPHLRGAKQRGRAGRQAAHPPGKLRRSLQPGAAVLPVTVRAGAASHHLCVRIRARQGRDGRDPHPHAGPSDDHRRGARCGGRASARHGRHGGRHRAGARSDRYGSLADAEPDQKGRADADGPQGRRAGDGRRR